MAQIVKSVLQETTVKVTILVTKKQVKKYAQRDGLEMTAGTESSFHCLILNVPMFLAVIMEGHVSITPVAACQALGATSVNST